MDGDQFNYRLVRFLGHGAFGATFEALTADAKRVAIKFIFPVQGKSMNEGIKEVRNYLKVADIAEREKMNTISCQPNLLCFYTAGELYNDSYVFNELNKVYRTMNTGKNLDPNLPIVYIVTEFLEGDDLKKLIQKGFRLRLEDIKIFLSSMLRALNYLHKRNIAHRDVKPENIIRTRDGRYVLIDFGVICTDPFCYPFGDLRYMTNESLMISDAGGEAPIKMAQAGDFFALALTLYEFVSRSFIQLHRLENRVFQFSELPILNTQSQLINDIYNYLLEDYNYIASDPNAVLRLLRRLS